MTEIARELLEGVNLNDYVKIRYGTTENQDSAEGTIIRLSENFLYLRKNDGGEIRIRLDDSLRTLEVIMQKPTPLPPPEPAPVIPAKVAFQILRQPVELSPAQPYKFALKDWLDALKDLVKKFTDNVIKNSASSLLVSLETAEKNNNMGYKYHDLRAKILQFWEDCETDIEHEFFYLALGILAVTAKDYEYALEPLVRAKKYSLAAYSAGLAQRTDDAEVFAMCAVLSGETSEITQDVAEICVRRKDVEVLRRLLETPSATDELCEKIFACAVKIFTASGGKLTGDIHAEERAFDAAEKLLAAVPATWKKPSAILQRWEEYQNYSYPEAVVKAKKISGGKLVGKIYEYKPDRRYGFISPNYYFHVKQVFDDTDAGVLLRKMLSLGLWNQLEVSFKLGKGYSDPSKPAAYEVELTDEGYQAAMERAKTGKTLSTGVVEKFFPYHLDGRIICNEDGQIYKFSTAEIADPWLRAYYEKNPVPGEQSVVFRISGVERAADICWQNPSADDYETYADFVSETAREDWEKFLAEKNSAQKITPLPADDPYKIFYYSSLPEWTGGTSTKKIAPLTWNLKSAKKISVPTPSPVSAPRPNSAEQNRRAVFLPNIEAEERYFQNSLRTEGFSESAFNALISLYIRGDGKTEQALELISRYGNQLSKDKLINAKIRVYEKRKDYVALVDLYEEGIKNTPSVPKRAHYLFSLIGIYVNRKDYENALKVCQRWKNFYQQNQFSSEAEKLKLNVPNVSRREAVCLYYLGRLDEARAIATDLVRANPADEVANNILTGTLSDGNLAAINPADEGNFDDNLEGKDFVKYLIEQSKISANLKSAYLQGEEYTGSAGDFRKDLEMLIFGRRDRRDIENVKRTAETRSKNLFAACKLVRQLEQRGEIATFKLSDLAGRAITSWGDYMVSQSSQLDTPRMAYLYALEILHTPEEQDFCNAFNRYIRSFFLAPQGNGSLDSYISRQSNSGMNDGINTSIFAEAGISSVLKHEFLIGMLQLVLALKKTPRPQVTLIDDLYEKNSDLKSALAEELADFLGVQAATSKEEFKRQIDDAAELLEAQIESLQRELFKISQQFMESSLSESTLDNLEASDWQKYLNGTDVKRFNEIVALLKLTQNYYSGVNFDNRDDCLNRAAFNVNKLLDMIQQEPTDLSYNVFKPRLEQIRIKILDKQNALYQKFQPKLAWREDIQPFRTPEGKIQIQLIVQNERNYQKASALKIIDVQGLSGTQVFNLKLPPKDITLRGGEEANISFSIEIDSATDKSGNFSLSISYSYKFNDSPQNSIDKEASQNFNFVIHNEDFKRLENPFSSYEGKVMDDATMFFGRTKEIDAIVKMICPNGDGVMNYGRAIAMYGQTRTGKSSLLFHLERNLQETYGEKIWIWNVGNIGENLTDFGDNPNGYLPVFLYSLLSAAVESAEDNSEIERLIDEEDLEPPLDEILENKGFATAVFNNYMKKLNRVLKREQKIIIMFFDEFTYLHKYIKSGTISPEFMKFWKALLQDYCVFAIIAGQDDMLEFMRENQNEFACMEARKLTYLDEFAAKQLIREPLEKINNRTDLFSKDGTVDEIYRLTAGSAFLIIVLCSKFVDYLNSKGAYKITKGIFNDFLETRVFCPNSILTEEIHFEPQFRERGHEEFEEANKKILLSVARNSKDTGYAELDSITGDGLTAEEIQALVERLVDRNVLSRKDGNRYSIQVKLLEEWLLSTKGA